jgi:murein DD-endopeptidase MepM/ murein hydrolase activator NlpD
LLAWLIASPQVASAATTPQANIPPGWQTYTNPIYAYQIAYPSSWHNWGSDPRTGQDFSNYDQAAASDDFPPSGTDARVEVHAFQKPVTQSFNDWLLKMVGDLLPGGPPDKQGNWTPPVVKRNVTIAGFPAIILRWDTSAPRSVDEYLDAGAVVYNVGAGWSTGADAQTIQQILTSFTVVGTPDLARAAIPHIVKQARPLIGSPSPGLNLPMQVDHVWYDSSNGGWMSNQGMNGGGVNTWFDHDSYQYSDYHCESPPSLTRYDGNVYSSLCGTTGSCINSVSCYDGHPGIDFSTVVNGIPQLDVPVYAAATGTISVYPADQFCGNGLYLATTVAGHTVKILHCHLDTELITSGTVYRGEEIALSGCTGKQGCHGPHLHFAVYRVDVSPSERVDPFGWCGSGSDKDPNDIGYLWSTGSSCSPSPSFIGGPLYTVTPTLVGSWSSQKTDHYGVAYWWASNSNPPASAIWNAPTLGKSCYGAEVWVGATFDASDSNTQYVIHFTDGAPDKTVTINENWYTSWYTIYDGYNGGDTIGSITMNDNTGTSGQHIAAAKIWFQCY